MLAIIYIPIIAALNQKNFSKNYTLTTSIFLLLLVLNEVLFRFFSKIDVNSSGNSWACLFFYAALFFSLFVIYFEISKENVDNVSGKFITTAFIFGIMGVLYFFVTQSIRD